MKTAPTINDVAEALGMHKSTVSLALSGKGNVSASTRARVLSMAEHLGYEPNPLAQRLARGALSNLICLFTGSLDVGLTTTKVLGIQQQLTARGLEAPIYACGDVPGEHGAAQRRQIRQLCRQRPRAILCGTQHVAPVVFRELDSYARDGGTVVSYDSPAPVLCDQVLFEREDGSYRAARYLLERGHRQIGIGISNVASAAPHELDDAVAARIRGFRRALQEYGLGMRDDWFFRNATYERGGAEMAHRFLSLPERPTAVSIVNDYVAFAFMVEVMRAGLRVPHDVSIVSHDDQPVAEYCPVPLTTMSHPVDRIVSSVVDLLMQRLEGEPGAPPRITTLRGELIERASAAPLSS